MYSYLSISVSSLFTCDILNLDTVIYSLSMNLVSQCSSYSIIADIRRMLRMYFDHVTRV